jgi:signal transduction histidine kinase
MSVHALLKWQHKGSGVTHLKAGTRISVRFFSAVLAITAGILGVLGVYDYRAENVIKDLHDHYAQIDKFRSEIIHYDEILTMSARMAAATGDTKWVDRYKIYEPRLTAAINQAIAFSPGIYRKETDRNNIGKIKLLEMEHKAFDLIRSGHGIEAMAILFGDQYEAQKKDYVQAIERLNLFLKRQMDSALAVEKSKEYFARVAFITVLVMLLLSWLVIIRIARRSQEALIESNYQLSLRTLELDQLTHTLDHQVQERTSSLEAALKELQKTHEDLKNVQTQLLQSERFSAIGQLAAGVAHEINNPIGFINSNMQTLEQYVAHYSGVMNLLNDIEKAFKDRDEKRLSEILISWEKIRKGTNFDFIGRDIVSLIKESQEGAEKIRKIVLDLRAFASPDKGIVDLVNLEALIESVINVVWNEIKYKAELKREYAHVPPISCDPQKVGQVLVSILINAAQSIEGKGDITVRTYTEGENVLVDIADTGCGISPENITRIFDPFFTTKPVGQGVGLGLSVSYDIIKKHGGTITFKTQTGRGTTFTVQLPATAYVADSSQL